MHLKGWFSWEFLLYVVGPADASSLRRLGFLRVELREFACGWASGEVRVRRVTKTRARGFGDTPALVLGPAF